jgi:hypothetical protein
MLGWFGKPTCPVDDEIREWVESRWHWLGGAFGWDRLRKAEVILPTPQHFPDSYDPGEEDSIRKLFDRVCGYAGVNPTRFRLEFYSEEDAPPLEDARGRRSGTAGLYEAGAAPTVWIEVSKLDDPVSVIGTMAHEVGHELLLGEGRVSDQEEDHEPSTDLLTVFLGLGVFPANSSVLSTSWYSGGWSGWSIGRQGYLDMRTFGYAFALFARMRGEPRAAWVRELRLDVRDSFRKGLRFLDDRNDPRFGPPEGRTD